MIDVNGGVGYCCWVVGGFRWLSYKIMNQGKESKLEEKTASTEEDHSKESLVRLIQSEHLSLEMAVNYLFQWRKNSKISGLLLERIQQFCLDKSVHFIPSIIFIMSLQYHDQFFKFCQKLAHTSLPLYLTVRWSYSAYEADLKNSEDLRNKLDSSLISKFKYSNEENFDQEDFRRNLSEKENYSNYLSCLNDFYEQLFKIPEKLKKYDKPKRNEKLGQYLNKIYNSFMKNQNGYLNGIAFPIDESSPICIRIITPCCFTFSTKERVPFKIVFETISYEDALKCRNGVLPGSQEQKEGKQQATADSEDKMLILPQTYFGELWAASQKKIREESPYSCIPSYQIRSFMIKSGDDLRQEYMALQLIKLIEEISKKENLKLWIRSYSIIPFNGDSGLIEFVPDTRTVSYLKQKSKQKSLRKIYQQLFGVNWQQSITNFIHSLAGYSLVQYLFQIKDRHNNNILIDTSGHVIHIDFSFILSSSPGNMNFERAPFKLTADYIELMQGRESDIFKHFKLLFFLGLKFLRKYKKEIMESVVMMSHCQMKCFEKFDEVAMSKRFHDTATDEELEAIVDRIMVDAESSYTTSSYDKYQWYTNFIYS